jgi:hypothetical protein
MGRHRDEIERAATARAREAAALEVIEQRRLARCRTLLAVAAEKINSVPDSHPQRREMERKLRVVKDRLRVQEREAS